ncbi:MAG: hypothetical protein H0W82_07700 [Actinobacteria bacterium]|nr:hypothetical protein [Actinomycetota bacterium]
MRKQLRENGLSIAMFGLFAIFLIGQVFTGWNSYDADQLSHGARAIGLWSYLTTGHFIEAVFENWESEFLQMASYIVLTVWLVQKGSAESNPLDGGSGDDAGSTETPADAPAPVRRGGTWLSLYERSLGLSFALLFLLSIGLHAWGGARAYSEEQKQHGEAPVSVGEYATTSQFWFESFQNWQSEFLAVGSIVVLSIFLRQKDSPESKPVDAPHDQTGG